MSSRQLRSDDTITWRDGYGVGSDGALSVSSNITDSTANTTATGTAASSTLTVGSSSGFANGNLVLIHQTQGTGANVDPNWELNKISNVSGTTWTMSYPLTLTYSSGAQVYLLKQYTTVSVAGGSTVTGQTFSGGKGGILAYLAGASITISGGLDVSSKGFAGGTSSRTQPALQGDGYPGAQTSSKSANGNGGGGGNQSGAHASGSGGGGNAASPSGGSGLDPGSGGGTAGNASLTIIQFGGGGAEGDTDSNVQTTPGAGGAGGGMIFLISPSVDTSAATINLGGGNGAAGSAPDGTYHSCGGAGGAGGSCIIKGQRVVLGSSTVTASGGTHGSNNNGQTHCGVSTDGSVGRIHVDYSDSISGTTSPSVDSRVDTSLGTKFFGGVL